MSLLPNTPWMGVGGQKYDRNSNMDSELSEGKSKNSQASALPPSASCDMVPEYWLSTAEGGSSCVALGQ